MCCIVSYVAHNECKCTTTLNSVFAKLMMGIGMMTTRSDAESGDDDSDDGDDDDNDDDDDDKDL